MQTAVKPNPLHSGENMANKTTVTIIVGKKYANEYERAVLTALKKEKTNEAVIRSRGPNVYTAVKLLERLKARGFKVESLETYTDDIEIDGKFISVGAIEAKVHS